MRGAVVLEGVGKSFGGAFGVRDVWLEIRPGEFLTLLGPSGCGKTTTLRLIAGFIEPDGGEIRIGPKRIAARGSSLPPERRNMAMIFQSYALWPHMTVAQNLDFTLELRRIRGAEAKRRIDETLGLVDKIGRAHV